MNQNEFVRHLLNIVDLPTYYSNKYPNNLGYVHSDGRRSFDCWNLIKAVLNGYDETNNTVGYYQRDLSKTGDTNADGLIKQCRDVSTDFTKISVPGAFLYYYDGTHAGTFVGEHEIGGKLYNVIECTAAWDKKVLWSWVDADGTRRNWKGCRSKVGAWSKYGYFKMLDETQAHAVNAGMTQADAGKKQEAAGRTYKVVKGDTLWGIAQKFLGSGIKWRKIYDYNDLKTTTIQIGQILKIPND